MMRQWFRIIFILIPLFMVSLSCDDSPTSPDSTGKIQLVIVDDTDTQDSEADSTSATNKQTATATLTELEIRILTSSNTVVATETLFPVEGYFEGTIEVKAQNNLKVLCIGKNNGIVERFALDPDVDVKAGQTATAAIPETHWYASYIPVINNITPNPSVDGSYNVLWSAVPNASMYVLEEADNAGLAGIGEVYSGAEPMRGFSGMLPATYYYRVRATNAYGIASGWSDIKSLVVTAPAAVYTISGTVTGADSVEVELSGDASGSLLVRDGGNYFFTVSSGTYIVTPSKTGYSFEPSSSSYYNISSTQTQNFTGTTSATYTISGTITGADAVLITLSGDDTGTQVVNSGETYSFIVTHGGTYTITPSRTDFKFTPSSISFTDVIANQTQDFVGERPAVSYTLTIGQNNNNWGSVTPSVGTHTYASGDVVTLTAEPAEWFRFVSWEGDVLDSTSPTTTITMSKDITVIAYFELIQDELYTLTLLSEPPGGGMVSAYQTTHTKFYKGEEVSIQAIPKSGYRFVGWSENTENPTAQFSYVVIDANMTVTAYFEKVIYAISGIVTGADGVVITLSGDKLMSMAVNNGGSYSFNVEYGSYTVTPSKGGYIFNPTYKFFENIQANKTQDFIATEIFHPPDLIAFVSQRDGNWEIYIMNEDGSNQTNITNSSADEWDPSWSPDGSRIVFSSNREGNYEIYVMDVDGSNQTRLTSSPNDDGVPAWSLDSMQIAFESKRDGNSEIYIMNADGSDQRNVTNNPADDYLPSWSPDSSTIAFVSNRNENGEIYIMDIDGSNQIRVTYNDVDDHFPSFSPDGTHIAFQSDRDGNYEIYTMTVGGFNQKNISNSPYEETVPTWSPDGSHIAFASNRDGNFEIYIMEADGSNPRNVTNNPAGDFQPAWSPF